MNITQSHFPRVVIIGVGFAGLATAKGLKEQELQVIFIDKHNYHTFNRYSIKRPQAVWNQILFFYL